MATTTDYIDPDMKELLGVLGASIVPTNRRRAVFHTNWHTPYYSHTRYRKVA